MHATEYVRCDRTNDLIGPRQFGWSANFENSMKARARCSPAMKLSIPGETYFTYCRTVSNRVSMNLSLFYRPQTRPHVLNCPRNELSDPTRCSFHRWCRQCPTNFKTLDPLFPCHVDCLFSAVGYCRISRTSLRFIDDLSCPFYRGSMEIETFSLFHFFFFSFPFWQIGERFWIYPHKDVRAKSYFFQEE